MCPAFDLNDGEEIQRYMFKCEKCHRWFNNSGVELLPSDQYHGKQIYIAEYYNGNDIRSPFMKTICRECFKGDK